MLRPEFSPRPLAADGNPDAIALPLAAPGPRAFSALFGELQAEVADFIENGSGSPTALSAEGRFHQFRLQSAPAAADAGSDAQQDFAAAVAPWAREAAQRLGVSADILTAHAALESGWGQHPLRRPDGSDSHNLFGLKAGGNWSGAAIDAATTEYENGAPQGRVERFRSYPDAASAFRDFTRLLLDNPRYQGALNAGSDARAYAQGLTRGGYATDPAYADKLVRLANRLQSGD
ncbi:MAG: flgJ [Rhodocyclaceae bacterium]|nr:flgJ [Rhodocyclaceae bacterium]